MNTKNYNAILRLIQLIVLSGSLIAINPAMAEKYAPEGIRSGSVIYYPYASLSVGNDDNVLSQETNPTSSTVTSLSAGVTMRIAQPGSRGEFNVELEAQNGTFDSSPDDDYTDSAISAGYTYAPSDKLSLKVAAGIKQLHDARTPTTLPASSTPDEYKDTTVDGEWHYGINDWEGADTLVALNLTDRVYQSNVAVNQAKDRQQISISGLLRFPVAPNTRLRISGRHITFDYDTTDTKDSDQLRLMVGVEWQISDQTLLSADLGGQEKNFDQNSAADDSDSAWEISMTWTPEDFNKVKLTTSNDFDESLTAATHLNKRKVGLVWSYEWDDYLTSLLTVETSEDSSVNGATTTVDTINYFSLSVKYGLTRTVMIDGGISRTDVDSDIAGNSSVKNVFSIGLTAAF